MLIENEVWERQSCVPLQMELPSFLALVSRASP